MNKTTVVNIKNTPNFQKGSMAPITDIYIGRFHNSTEHGYLAKSKWHNPFRIGTRLNDLADSDTLISRETSLTMYRDYIIHDPVLMASLHELKGKRLGCWCKPLACHGDALIELVNELPLTQD